jgi:16S rRNA (cytosine967-C5)-methyltransferase
VDALKRDWPSDYTAILDANNGHPPFWLRVNQRRGATEAYRERLAAIGVTATRSSTVPEALLLERPLDVAELPGFAEGDASVQDAGAQLAAHVVGPRRGERILDACAAPGGKTAHLLELEPELAELVAVDSSAERLQRVRENLHRLGLCATLLEADAAALAQWWDGRPFDRVLLDVPCSASGVIRRHPDIKLLRREADIPRFAAQQARLLEQVWQVLVAGGRLIYASCSVLERENAAVIAEFLDRHPEAKDETAQVMARLGLPSQPSPGHKFAPMTAGSDGFYYACLVKATKVM